MTRAWCWFCWRTTNDWWPFGFGPIAKPVYFWMLPYAGDYIYFDFPEVKQAIK